MNVCLPTNNRLNLITLLILNIGVIESTVETQSQDVIDLMMTFILYDRCSVSFALTSTHQFCACDLAPQLPDLPG